MVRGVQEIREFLLAEKRWVRERPYATETRITEQRITASPT